MTNISLQSPSSQPEKLDTQATTITLKDPASKTGNSPKEFQNLEEAKTLPEGAVQIMPETVSTWKNTVSEKNGNVFINTQYYIPYILWGKLFVRKVHEVSNSHQKIHTFVVIDESGVNCGIHQTYCSSETKPDEYLWGFFNENTKIEEPVETEIDGKPAIIFRRLHSNKKDHIYLIYYGDKTVIKKLRKIYVSRMAIQNASSGVQAAVQEVPKTASGGILAKLFRSLNKG